MPNYSVDWAVEDDYYNSYAMTEDRKGDTTKNIIRVALPGKSMIKRDDLIDAQMRLSQSVGGYSSSSGILSGGLLNDDVLIGSGKLNSGLVGGVRLGSAYGKSAY